MPHGKAPLRARTGGLIPAGFAAGRLSGFDRGYFGIRTVSMM